MIFASLLAAGGVFIYELYLTRVETSEVAALNQEIAAFDEAKLESLTAFDNRLAKARGRLDATADVSKFFSTLESLTVTSVTFEELLLTRVGDEKFVATVRMETDSFDSTLFQRGVLAGGGFIEQVYFDDVTVVTPDLEGESVDVADPFSIPRQVQVAAEIHVPLAGLLYAAASPSAAQILLPEATEPEQSVTDTSETQTESTTNQTDL
jgi:hypothetical protein